MAQPDLTVTTTEHGGNPVDFVFPRFDTVKIGWQLYQGDPTPAAYDMLDRRHRAGHRTRRLLTDVLKRLKITYMVRDTAKCSGGVACLLCPVP